MDSAISRSVNGELADLIADFWESPLVIEATGAILKGPEREPAAWARVLEGMVL